MKNSIKRRLLSLLLALVMVLTLAPAAWAEPTEEPNPPASAGDGETDPPASAGDGETDPPASAGDGETDPPASAGDGETDPPASAGDGETDPPASAGDGETDPPASAGDEETDPPDPTPGDVVTAITLGGDQKLEESDGDTDYQITLEPGSVENQGGRIEAHLEPDTPAVRELHPTWTPTNSEVVRVGEEDNGRVGTLLGLTAGEQVVTVTAGSNRKTATIKVTVSGIKALPSLANGISVKENESVEIKLGEDYQLYGSADAAGAELRTSTVTGGANIFIPVPSEDKTITIQGRKEGNSTVELSVSAGGRSYSIEIRVAVTANTVEFDSPTPASVTAPLRFSNLEDLIDERCKDKELTGSPLSFITELKVSPVQGIIYQGYNSPNDTGSGAGSGITYYAASGQRGPYIKDLTFVPNPDYRGATAEITFTGTAGNGRTFKGKIIVPITDSAKDPTILLTTRSDAPLKLKAEDFARVCQGQTGAALDHVVFTLPPAGQGVLYLDYKNELDYGARVSAVEEYNRRALDDITFVPAQGYVGDVVVGYSLYSVTGGKYTGEATIRVTPSLDASIRYRGAGSVTLRGSDFDAYSQAMTGAAMYTEGRVSFTALPPAGQGALYYRWSGGRGTEVKAGEGYTLSQLNDVTFVAADGFDGVVRIPFTGTNRYGAAFSGTAEFYIQTDSGSNGDISYDCQPGQSVKLLLTDFANLCQAMTGERLYYVTFQELPDFTQGSLFYNRTSSGAIGERVSTAAKYFNSAVPYLSNVSFWAATGFRGVRVPFTLASVGGTTFSGVMAISSGVGAGSGSAGAIRYTTTGRQPVKFSAADFDAACRQATNSALQYLRFTPPDFWQGILYSDYHTESAATVLDPNTALYLTGSVSVGKATFVPAYGFSGTVSIPFDATAINGASFQGAVEVTVQAGTSISGIIHYATGGAPVRLQGYDVSLASGIGQPSAVRFTALPDASQGRLYYQYGGPTQYTGLGSTTLTYSVTGEPSLSNLTFVPRAGYQGVVVIPYTAAGYGGATATGTIEIIVVLPGVSADFDDLADCTDETRSAVECLASLGVVNGTGYRTYEPENSILRGDFCLMVSRAFRFQVSGGSQDFSDVPPGHYYTQAIREMYAMGIVLGVGGGRFQPEATITRQDAAVMVRRALDRAGLTLPGGSNEAALAGFEDQDQVDGYARDALGSLVRAGLFPVSGDELFPKEPISRADMALLLHRAVTNF